MIRERLAQASADADRERDELVLARARARAKSAWAASQRDDDLTLRTASEERLIAAWPRPRVLPLRAFVLGAATAACVAAASLVALRSGSRPSHPADGAAVAPRAASSAVAVALATGALESAPRVTAVVFAAACPECRITIGARESAVVPGLTLGVERVSVPRGARLTLGFALPGALVDPTSGVDLEGPAVASAPDDQTLSLERGSARFRGLRDVALSVPGARVIAEGATFTVSIDARGIARIEVEKGHLVVTPLANPKQPGAGVSLDAGGSFQVAVNQAAQAAQAPPSAHTTDTTPMGPTTATSAASADPVAVAVDPVASARARFHDGDAAAARTQLEALIHSKDAGVARRASFTLAEIEMAGGERDRGRVRLTELVTCPDVRLAADAATLLAHSERSAAARAESWAHYLATSPPSAYRELALLERAEALFDAGRPRDANEIIAELRTLPLSEARKRQLERLTYKTHH